MAQQQAPQEVNNLSGGLNTDANPINFPPDSCKDMDNIVLDRNGLSRRRLGIDFEDSNVKIATTEGLVPDLAINTFKWENAGGDTDKSLLVVQVGKEIKIIDLDSQPISDGVIYTYEFTTSDATTQASFASIDSILVAVNGDGTVYTYTYNPTTAAITLTTDRILVRDLWGVDVTLDGKNLFEGNNIITRPKNINSEHIYNLRNQSFGIARAVDTDESTKTYDPIFNFLFSSQSNDIPVADRGFYPSNSDSVNYAYYPKTTTLSNQLPRFWADDLVANKIGTFEAPRGYFIIDALNRGNSRIAAEVDNRSNQSPLNSLVVFALPEDRTPTGATITAEFAGRAWFAGFSGDTVNGDSRSPRLSSYIMFSRLVQSATDTTLCYQSSDPTSDIDNGIVATDGGFIRIDGAYDIKAIVPSGNSLFVIAANGVWRILGGSDYGFGADNYRVDRVSNEGCRSTNSVVYVDGSIMYWGDKGIFAIAQSNLGDWGVQSMSRDRVQVLYDAIPIERKQISYGVFDRFTRKVRWLYNNSPNITDPVKELVYDVDLDAFYNNTYASVEDNLPKVVSLAESNQFVEGSTVENVTHDGVLVTHLGEQVVNTITSRSSVSTELVYIVITNTTGPIQYTIASLRDTDFIDWKSHDDTGIDAPAYLVTGEFNTGDNQRRKQNKQLVLHLERTEDGFEDVAGELVFVNQSSCFVQARWDWSNTNQANRWSNPRQFYRYKRNYTPVDVNDNADNGMQLIITKDKLRGHGKALSIKMSTEPLKDMRVFGWSSIWGIGDD